MYIFKYVLMNMYMYICVYILVYFIDIHTHIHTLIYMYIYAGTNGGFSWMEEDGKYVFFHSDVKKTVSRDVFILFLTTPHL